VLLPDPKFTGQGARRRCPVCNKTINVKTTGRTRRFCSDTCRELARRDRNFHGFGVTRPVGSAMPRNPEISSTNSAACGGTLADRAPRFRVVAGPPVPAANLIIPPFIDRLANTASIPQSERREFIQCAVELEFAARWPIGGAR
jgi:hypothetical protein